MNMYDFYKFSSMNIWFPVLDNIEDVRVPETRRVKMDGVMPSDVSIDEVIEAVEDFEKAEKYCSDKVLYELAGNSVPTRLVESIGEKILQEVGF